MTKKPDVEFIERMVMSMVNDAVTAEVYAARVRVQVAAMAKEYGIRMPEPEEID